jgi:hypothetical protein
MSIPWDKIKTFFSPRRLMGSFGGRSFLVVVFFSVTGFYLELHGKLDANYAALATALAGFHIWRARSEDDHGDKP